MKHRDFTISLAMAGWVPGAYAGNWVDAVDSTGASGRRPQKIPHYKRVVLDGGAGAYSAAFALSNNGQAAGSLGFNIAGGYRPALFVPGQPAQPLYTDGPGQAQGINNRAEVVGWFRQGEVTQAFRRRKDRIDTLRSPGGGSSQALALNNRGDVVGFDYDGPRDPRYVGMLWADRGQSPVSLQGAIDPADAAQWILMEAFALNNAGVVAGHGFCRPPGARTSTRAYLLIPQD